jgi:hypothetical protein
MVFVIVFTARKTIVQGKNSAISFTPVTSQKFIPQSEEFTDIKNIVISRCVPTPAAP